MKGIGNLASQNVVIIPGGSWIAVDGKTQKAIEQVVLSLEDPDVKSTKFVPSTAE